MENIKVYFLGTGNAIPTKLRNHTGILVNFLNESILIDCGENIQRQFKIAELGLARITKILITHWHGDHILGLPGLFQTLAMSNYSKTLHLYGPHGSKHYFNAILQILRGLRINIEVHEVSSGVFFQTKDYMLEAAAMEHGAPALAYSIILKDKRRLDKKKLRKYKIPNSPLLGELQKGKDIVFNGEKITSKSVSYVEKGKKITVVLDTAINQRAVQLAKDSELLIAESTFAKDEQEKAKEYKHLTATDAATIAKKARVKKLLLTHISERYEHSPNVIEKEAKKTFKNTAIAKDFDIIAI